MAFVELEALRYGYPRDFLLVISSGMTVDELRSLPPGTKLVYVFGKDDRHPAKLLEHSAGWTAVLIYYMNKPQQKVRWSTSTNRPIGTRGYAGTVRLEIAVAT